MEDKFKEYKGKTIERLDDCERFIFASINGNKADLLTACVPEDMLSCAITLINHACEVGVSSYVMCQFLLDLHKTMEKF